MIIYHQWNTKIYKKLRKILSGKLLTDQDPELKVLYDAYLRNGMHNEGLVEVQNEIDYRSKIANEKEDPTGLAEVKAALAKSEHEAELQSRFNKTLLGKASKAINKLTGIEDRGILRSLSETIAAFRVNVILLFCILGPKKI
jgi:hypothetical protein